MYMLMYLPTEVSTVHVHVLAQHTQLMYCKCNEGLTTILLVLCISSLHTDRLTSHTIKTHTMRKARNQGYIHTCIYTCDMYHMYMYMYVQVIIN